ncbi:MAG: hypothetical protein WC640_03635 [Candidatus Paceibacterota bacterium]|jgi:hypothetical protein
MLLTQRFWAWVVLAVSAGAYVPLAVGGWQHPEEINVASYSLWFILASMLLYSSRAQGFTGWRMPLGFVVGNGSMLMLGFCRREYTFNLGSAETMVLYGLIATTSTWVAVGQTTGKWNPRILFLGGVAADILSFYPQLKQYLMPHDAPTSWMIIGWCLWVLGASINVVLVEQLFTKLRMKKEAYEKLYTKPKRPLLIIEESMFSLENGLFMIVTVLVMTR